MKVILNKCYGGFDVSPEAYILYAKKKGMKLYEYSATTLNGAIIYSKSDNQSCFTEYFTKDFGDIARISNEDCETYHLYLDEEHRTDKTLIEVIEELGKKASGRFGNLKVVEIPDNCYYKIDEYDGVETIYYSTSEIKEK